MTKAISKLKGIVSGSKNNRLLSNQAIQQTQKNHVAELGVGHAALAAEVLAYEHLESRSISW